MRKLLLALLLLLPFNMASAATILETGETYPPNNTDTTAYGFFVPFSPLGGYGVFHQPGIVKYVTGIYRRLGGSGTDTLRIQLKNDLGSDLDCQTETKSYDDWGIVVDSRLTSLGPFTGTQCDILSSASPYDTRHLTNVTSGATLVEKVIDGAVPFSWYILSDELPVGVIDNDTTTHISFTSPYNGLVASTSGFFFNSDTYPWTYQAGGYINPADGDLTNVSENTGIRIKWHIGSRAASLTNCIDAICAFNRSATGYTYYSRTGYVEFGSQSFSVSTTSTDVLPADYYDLRVQIVKPATIWGFSSIFGLSLGENVLAEKTARFKVGSTTALQDLINSTRPPAPGNFNATTTDALADSCNLVSFSFDISDCIQLLFIPNSADVASVVNLAKDGFFTRAPWGYVTRLVTILSNNAATSTLPTFTIQFATSSPLFGSELTFNMQDTLSGGATLLGGIQDPISHKTLREITEPWIQLFIAICALIIVYHDIMAMGHENKNRNDKRT